MRQRIKILSLAIVLIMIAGILLADAPAALCLFDITPNPMDKHTTITVTFNHKENVTITVERLDGTVVKDIFAGELLAGTHQFGWDRYTNGGQFADAGKYMVNVSYTSKYTSTKKTLILK